MHKCVVCGNLSRKTRCIRPGVIYHGFPKNEYMRRKWLKVFGIDHCYDWQRVCSDHFLEENYKPGIKRFLFANTIPQPYNRKCDKNDVPSNYVTPSKDVETGNNVVLPIGQCIIKEEYIENNIQSLRRSRRKIKLTTNNEDMSYKNMPSLQTENIKTEVVPMLTTAKDHTLGSGLLCSVKNCLNRHSKNLSFFGYPKDLTLRKKWMEKCGLKRDPTALSISAVRVCCTHFDDDCFKDSKIKKRLKPGAVPSLFLPDADIIDTRNISPVNGGCISANKPSYSSSNYVANMKSNQTPLLVYMESTTRKAKDFEACCSIPRCITNTVQDEFEDISLFAPTIECVNDWSSILGLQLTINSIVCERHFRPQDILNPELLVNGINKKIKSLAPYSLPIKNNKVPVLKTYEDQFLSQINNKTDEQSSEKRINYELDNTDNCCIPNLMSIDDSSANNSLLIDLEPIENSEVLIEPSVDLSISPTKKSSSSELIEINTQVTSKCTALTRNSDTHDSNSDTYDSNSDTDDSNSDTDDSNSDTHDSNSDTDDFNSDTHDFNSDTHDSNSDYSIGTPQCNIIDLRNIEDFKIDKDRFIFEISKTAILPNSYWKGEHCISINATGFYERDSCGVTVKKIHFYNSLVPVIQIYNKKYKYFKPITSKNQLEKLLQQICDVEKCHGRYGLHHKNCIGYMENSSEEISMCSVCNGWITNQDLKRKLRQVESKSRTIESLETKIIKSEARILKLRKSMAKNKKNMSTYIDLL